MTILSLFSKPIKGSCDPGWLTHGEFCYHKVSAKTWQGAYDGCRNMEADLISIHSESDRRWLSSVNMGDSWIGLQKLEPYITNNFEWTDGTPYDFTAWKEGRPTIDGGEAG